jgi:hypothetical protein
MMFIKCPLIGFAPFGRKLNYCAEFEEFLDSIWELEWGNEVGYALTFAGLYKYSVECPFCRYRQLYLNCAVWPQFRQSLGFGLPLPFWKGLSAWAHTDMSLPVSYIGSRRSLTPTVYLAVFELFRWHYHSSIRKKKRRYTPLDRKTLYVHNTGSSQSKFRVARFAVNAVFPSRTIITFDRHEINPNVLLEWKLSKI